MHYVSEVRPSPPPPRDRSLLDVPVIYFQTYVGAAVKAAGLGLLDRRGVEAVIARALGELEGGGKEGENKGGGKATPEQLADLMRDIELAKRTVLMKEEEGGGGEGKEGGRGGGGVGVNSKAVSTAGYDGAGATSCSQIDFGGGRKRVRERGKGMRAWVYCVTSREERREEVRKGGKGWRKGKRQV